MDRRMLHNSLVLSSVMADQWFVCVLEVPLLGLNHSALFHICRFHPVTYTNNLKYCELLPAHPPTHDNEIILDVISV